MYSISRGQITSANKKFTSIDNEYRIIFNNESHIFEYQPSEKDEKQFQRYKFNFVPIKAILESIHELKQLDVCGRALCDGLWDNIEVVSGREPVRGRLAFTLKDQSEESINVYLWGELSF